MRVQRAIIRYMTSPKISPPIGDDYRYAFSYLMMCLNVARDGRTLVASRSILELQQTAEALLNELATKRHEMTLEWEGIDP